MFVYRTSDKENIMACTYVVLIVTTLIFMPAYIPLLVIGYVDNYPTLEKYHDVNPYVCYGGNYITNYKITPEIYNTSLTYYPAQLHFTTVAEYVKSSGEQVVLNVSLTYPTLFETTFDCACSSKYCDQKPCEKMVGDVISKYNELKNLVSFPCYVNNNKVIGLFGEHGLISKKYKMSTAGIILISLHAVVIVGSFVILKCIRYEEYELPKHNKIELLLEERVN